jgi:hypothetical protein
MAPGQLLCCLPPVERVGPGWLRHAEAIAVGGNVPMEICKELGKQVRFRHRYVSVCILVVVLDCCLALWWKYLC